MEILDSARRHHIADEDIRHAVTNAIRHHDIDDGLVMVVGPSTAGVLIEVGIATTDAAEPAIVHAMPARAKFL